MEETNPMYSRILTFSSLHPYDSGLASYLKGDTTPTELFQISRVWKLPFLFLSQATSWRISKKEEDLPKHCSLYQTTWYD
jgi:hypothetical protein